METSQFAAERASRMIERLTYQTGITIKQRDADAVHDLRVAIRRLSQVLVVFKPCFPSKDLKKIRRNLKETMSLAGDVRNCDIGLKLLAKSQASDGAAIQQKLRVRRREAEQALLTRLRQWIARKSSSRWRAVLNSSHTDSGFGRLAVEEAASRRLAPMAKDFFKRGDHAADKASAEGLHQFRIAGKKFRYSLELFEGLYGPPGKNLLEETKDVQSLLGAINDCRTVRDMVTRMGASSPLQNALKKRQRRKTQDFRREWEQRFADLAVRRQKIDSLQHPPGRPVRKPMGHSNAATDREQVVQA